MKTSGELIDALKSGERLRRNPFGTDTAQFEFIQKDGDSYFVSGWGSAFGTANDRLLLIITNPELFSIAPDMICDGCMKEINDLDEYSTNGDAYFCLKCSIESE